MSGSTVDAHSLQVVENMLSIQKHLVGQIGAAILIAKGIKEGGIATKKNIPETSSKLDIQRLRFALRRAMINDLYKRRCVSNVIYTHDVELKMKLV
jgi:hypothetical protein